MKNVLLAGILLCVATTVSANFGSPSNSNEILSEQRRIREQVEAQYGKYSRFKPEAVARITRAQAVIDRLLMGGKSIEGLTKDQKVALFNAVEEVRAVINDNSGDKLLCERERKVGTTIKVVRCETVARRARIAEEAHTWKGDSTNCERRSGNVDCGGNARVSGRNGEAIP